jgi:hypothetical protein
MKRLFLFLPLVLMPLSASCDAGESRLSDEEFRAEAERIAREALLVDADFPTEWSGAPAEDDDEDDADASTEDEEFLKRLSDECRGFAEVLDENAGTGDSLFDATVSEESDTFSLENEDSFSPAEEVSSTIEVYREQGRLDDAWEGMSTFATECGDELNDVMSEVLKEELAAGDSEGLGGFDAQIDFETMEVEGHDALRMDMGVQFVVLGLPFDLDFAVTWVRVGRVVTSIEWTDFGTMDDDLRDTLLATVVERAEKADDTLPE